MGYGDEADREAEKRPEHDAAEQIENGLGEEDVRGPGDAFVYRAEDAHAAEAEGGNKGDDVHDVRLIAAVLAFREAEQRPDALGKKRFGKDEFADDGTHDEGHDHDGKCRSLVHEGGAHTQRDHAEDEGKRFLDAIRDKPGEEGPGEPSDEKSATVCNWSDHNT